MAAKPDTYTDKIKVDVHFDGSSWENLISRGFAHRVYDVVPFMAPTHTYEARVRFHMSTKNVGAYWTIYEFGFRKIGVNLISPGVPYYREEDPGVKIVKGGVGSPLTFKFGAMMDMLPSEYEVHVRRSDKLKIYTDADCLQELDSAGWKPIKDENGEPTGVSELVYSINDEGFTGSIRDKTLYVKGVEKSEEPMAEEVSCSFGKPVVYEEVTTYEVSASDRVNYTVRLFSAELALEVDRSGEITEFDLDHKAKPGGWVLVNDDWDNKTVGTDAAKTPVADVDYSGAIANENDLLKLEIRVDTEALGAGVKVRLESSSANGGEVRVWRKPTREERLELPAEWDMSVDAQKQDLDGIVAGGLWLEGMKCGLVKLTMKTSAGAESEDDSVLAKVVDDHNEGAPSGSPGQYGAVEAMTGAVAARGMVNLSTGNLYFSAPVTRLQNNLMPFNVVLSYNSRSKMASPLGSKFRTNYDMRVLVAGTRLLLIAEDGRRVWFDKEEGGQLYKSEPRRGVFGEIETKGNWPEFEKFMLRRKGSLYHEFDKHGRLVAVRDLHGGQPEATSFFDRAGDANKVTVAYQADDEAGPSEKIDKVTDSFGREIVFAWSGSEVTVKSPGDSAGVTLSSSGLTGTCAEAWGFDAADWDSVVKVFKTPGQKSWTVTSDELSDGKGGHGRALEVARPSVAGKTSNPKKITYGVDGVVKVASWYDNEDAVQGAEHSYEVDAALDAWKKHTVKVGNGQADLVAERVYSADRLLESEKEFGGANTARWGYDSRGNVTSYTDLGGNEWKSTWTVLDRLEATTSPEGRGTSRSYEAYGDLTSFTDERGNITTYSNHDAHGRAGRRTLPAVEGASAVVTSDYGSSPFASPKTETRQAVADVPSATAEYEYTDRGWLMKAKDFGGKFSQMAYDQHGNMTHRTGPNDAEVAGFPGTLPAIYEKWDYDADDLASAYRNPDGGGVRYDRDELGRPKSRYMKIDGTREDRVDLAYDGRDNLVAETVYETVGVTKQLTTTFTYDLANRRTGMKLPGGRSTGYAYNARSLLETVADGRGNGWKTEYWPSGQVRTTSDPLLKKASYEYDRDGLGTKFTDAAGKWVGSEYWPDGSLRVARSAAGASEFDYNALGQKVLAKDADGRQAATKFNAFGWRQEDRLSAPGGTSPAVTTYPVHEASGAVKQALPPDGRVRTFTRDARDLVTGLAFTPFYAPASSESYSYTNNGLSAGTVDAKGKSWGVVRDFLGRAVQEYVPNASGNGTWTMVRRIFNVRGQVYQETMVPGDSTGGYTIETVTTNDFDDNGSLVKSETAGVQYHSVVDGNGDEVASWVGNEPDLATAQAAGVVTTYERNAARRVERRTNPDGKVWVYGYDDAGRLTSVKNPLGFTTVTDYDDAGRVWRVHDGRGAYTENQYYPSGLLKASRDKNGLWTSYTYDERGRMTSKTDPAGHAVTYEYQDSPPTVTITDPDGMKTRRTMDVWGNVVKEERIAGGVTKLVFSASYDERGVLVGMANARGQTMTVTPDNLGRPSTKAYSTGLVLNYTWTQDGLLKSVTGGGTNLSYGYDDGRRLKSVTDGALGKTVGYDYDERGRRWKMQATGLDETVYGYDGSDRLRTLTRGGKVANFAYDNAGRPWWVDLPNGVRTTYAYDPADRLVGVGHTKAGSTLASAVYQLDNAGNRLRETYEDGSAAVFGYDLSYRLVYENVPGGAGVRYYGYSAGGDRLWEARPNWTTFENTWSDGFNRADLGTSWEVSGGQWRTTTPAPEAGEERQLERYAEDVEKASGPGMVTWKDQLTAWPFELRAEFAPPTATKESPLTAAMVFGRTDADNYFLAGTRSYSAVPEGEVDARLHVTYFVARVKDAEAPETLAESAEPEVLPADVAKFELRLRVTAATAELSRKYSGQDWDHKVTGGLPWAVGGQIPASRFGFYSDRKSPDTAACTFDNITLQWNTGAPTLELARYSYDAFHQLMDVTGLGKDASYTYDADGNRLTETKGGVTTTYGYSFENHLLNVQRGGGTIRSYAYQGDTWQRRTATEDGVTTSFIYDGADILAEFGAGGALAAHHVTNGIDKTLWSVRGGQFTTSLAGAQNVMAVADANGVVTAKYRYSAWGQRTQVYGQTEPNRMDPTFQGRTFDAGLGIYDYRSRSFDPSTGRFLQRDPVLGGDPLYNPYCFPGNNPVTNMDPMGNMLTVEDKTTAEAVRAILAGIGLSVRIVTPAKGSQYAGKYHVHLDGVPELVRGLARARTPFGPLAVPNEFGMPMPRQLSADEKTNRRIRDLVTMILDEDFRWLMDSKGNTERVSTLDYAVPVTFSEFTDYWGGMVGATGKGLGQGGLNVIEGTTNSLSGLANTGIRGLTLGAVESPIPKINLNVTNEPENWHRASTFFGGDIGGTTLLTLGVGHLAHLRALARGAEAAAETTEIAGALARPAFEYGTASAEVLGSGVRGETSLRSGWVTIREGMTTAMETGALRHEAVHRTISRAVPEALKGVRVALYQRSALFQAGEEIAAGTYATGGRVGLAWSQPFYNGYTLAGGQLVTGARVAAEVSLLRLGIKTPETSAEVGNAIDAILGR